MKYRRAKIPRVAPKFKRGQSVTNRFTGIKGTVKFNSPKFFTVQTKLGHRITNPKYWK